MYLSEMAFSEEASRKLSQLKRRTGLTPNILARIGFCMSLENPALPDPTDYEGSGYISIKRHVLTGHYDPLFVALTKERCHQDQLPEEEWVVQFKAHMNRGVVLLYKKFKSLDNFASILPPSMRQTQQTHE